MRVALISFQTFWSLHFATELEIAMAHLESGDDLLFYRCASTSPNCRLNAYKDPLICVRCESRARRGRQLAELPRRCIRRLVWYGDEVDAVDIPRFESLDEIKEFEFRGVDVGMAALSSIISIRRNPAIDLDENRWLLETTVRSAINSTLNAERIIQTDRPDRIVVFNGRLANQRPFVRMAKAMGVDFACHERGASMKRYAQFHNAMPHEFDAVTRRIEASYRHAQDAEDEARQFYSQRRARDDAEQPWKSFVKEQTRTLLPDGFEPEKHNIAIFNSSEDEFAAIDRQPDAVFENQNEGIRAIARHFESSLDIHVYLRVHPNLRSVSNEQTEGIAALHDEAGVTVLPANSPVDSYALLDACDVAMTFGSTMGAEATYWGKPAVLVGQSYYADLDCAHVAHDIEELLDLLSRRDLPPKSPDGAIKYGNYLRTNGQPFRHYVAYDWAHEGDFRGVRLDVDRWGAAYELAMGLLRHRRVNRGYRAVRDSAPVRRILRPGALRRGIERVLSKFL